MHAILAPLASGRLLISSACTILAETKGLYALSKKLYAYKNFLVNADVTKSNKKKKKLDKIASVTCIHFASQNGGRHLHLKPFIRAIFFLMFSKLYS